MPSSNEERAREIVMNQGGLHLDERLLLAERQIQAACAQALREAAREMSGLEREAMASGGRYDEYHPGQEHAYERAAQELHARAEQYEQKQEKA